MKHIIKMDAKWKSHRTRDLIDLLHEITLLRFKDLKRSMYGDGNYQLQGDFKKRYAIKSDHWKPLSEEEKRQKFNNFLANAKKARYCQDKENEVKKQSVKSSYCDFTVPLVKLAKKP